MADPVTWAAIGTWASSGAGIATIASTAIGAVGAIASGNQAKNAADAQAQTMDYNAKLDQSRATRAQEVAGIQEDRQRQQARAVVGEQLASSAGAGAGLNSDLLRQSLFNMDSDTADIRYEGAVKAAGLNDQAALTRANAETTRQQGKSAQTAGYLNAAGSLLNAGTSYYKGTSGLKTR